ncbi:hypothetical protein Pint_21924 [Pistacia integerrima]|uniref:Uncharacterized protein n=1 Tax=Pistacia integerrima TaxID=434235 RepID=A0ACC0YN12_9ROSI|nr:hypothetical protein Pint_21924 [Pistacia integerrima]
MKNLVLFVGQIKLTWSCSLKFHSSREQKRSFTLYLLNRSTGWIETNMDDDRISALPPFTIHQIMSHLSRKQVSMKTFRLFISLVDLEGLPCSIDKWIRLAVEKDVKELDITIKADDKKVYILPQLIYTAKLLTT